jgi:protein SCO1/2
MTRRFVLTSLQAGAAVAAGERSSSERLGMRRYFPNVTLRTQEGKAVRFYDDVVAGKIIVLNLMFTNCNKYCPITTPKLVKVQRELLTQLGDRLRMVSLSIDAERDTPAALAAYGRRHRVQKGWFLLTGKRDDVDLIRRKLGLYDPEEKKLEHMGLLTVGNEPEGQWLALPVLSENDEIVRTVLRIAAPFGTAATIPAAR